MSQRTQATDDRTVDVGVVCALDLEAAPLIQRLAGRRKTTGDRFTVVEGTLVGRRVAVVRSGLGSTRLAAAADALLFVHRPRWLVAAGFAVGLSDQVHVGEIILANELLSSQLERLTVDVRPSPGVGATAGSHIGPLVSVVAWPRHAAEKRELKERSGACAADIQSFTLASLCGKQGVRFLAVRVVTEEALGDAAPESLVTYNPSRIYRAGAAVGAFLSGSGRVGKIWKQRESMKRCADRLAIVLAEIVPRLP